MPIDTNRLIQKELMGTGQPMPKGTPPMSNAQQEDPIMDAAIEVFTDAYGHPPESEEDFAELEAVIQAASQEPTTDAVVDQVAPELNAPDQSRFGAEPISASVHDRPQKTIPPGMAEDDLPYTDEYDYVGGKAEDPADLDAMIPKGIEYTGEQLWPAYNRFIEESQRVPTAFKDWGIIVEMYESGSDD